MITKASILHMMMTYYIIFVLLSLTTITTVLVSGQQHENIIINNNNNNVSNIINSRWSNYPIYNNHNDNGVDVHSSSSLNQFINVDEFRTNISKQFNFICNTQFGYYPDPGNCSSYYICSFGIPLHKNCSKGLYFSIRLQTCDWPANVQCEQDYLSLNAKTSMFNVIDEPKSSTSIVTTTTTTTPLPLPLLLSSDSAPLLSNNFFNKKSNIGSSSINHHYPTLQSSSPLSSKSTLIRNLTSLNLTPPLNSLEKHNYDSKLLNKLSPTYVVDGFEVPPASTTKTTNKNLNGLDKFTSHLSTFTNNSRINNAKFIEIRFEPYWTETGYFTIDDNGDNDDDDKRINPFTIYNDQSTPKSYFNDHHVDLHLISTNPYINNNDNNNKKRPEPLYWISNNNPSLQSRSIDSNQPRQQQQQQYSNQNIFRSSFNGYDGKNSLKKDSAIDGKLTTLKPLRRKIPELYIKIVSNDNFSTPFMSVNNNNNNNGQTNRGLIVLSKQPSPSSKAKAEKKLNYEINERLLAPFKHKTIEEDRLFSMIRSDNNIKNAEPKHRNHNGNVNEQQQKIVYSDGFNRYTDQKTTAIPTYKMINQVTHASRFRKKIIRKKKMNYQPTSSLSSLSPPSSAMAASSSSSLSNVYGHHPSTNLLTGTLVTSSFNNNNEQKIRRNSRPPLYKSLDKATTLPFNYPHNTSPRIWTHHHHHHHPSTTLKPTQRNRPQQLHETIGIYRKNNSSNKNDNINHHHNKLLMKSMNNDKTESVMVVPMDSNSNKYLNLAQYNSYVVMPNSYYNNENNKNSQTSKNDEIQKQFKNPIDTLEEFIKKTIKDVAKIEPQKYSVTSSSMTTTTTTTPLPPPSMLATTILPNTPQGFETKKEQVYKKIKAINGYRRSRKYRPLISLDQNISTKKSNITNSHHEQKSDIVTFTNRNNSKIINLSDPSTITVYETLKNNDVDQERTSSLYKTIDDQWSLTTTSSPLLTKLTYGDRSISSIIPTTIRPENWKENIDIPTDMNTIPITSTTKSPLYTLNKPKNKTKIGIKIRLPSSSTSTTSTTTTVPMITMLPKTGPTPKNYTEYNYYDYDNYDNVQDYNYDDEYYNNMLNDGKISTTTSTTTTTTTTLAPPSSSISSLSSFHMNNSIKRQNVTRQGKKPLIYLRNKPRPTIRRLIIKDPGENMKIISASRPQPLYPQPKALVTANKCDKRKCRLPDCRCGSSDIPGNFSSKQIPQLVMLTFDDAVNDLNWDLYEELLNSGRKNPNGCPIKATFYVSHEWTDYGQVQTLYSRGHEIASHTISHRFGEKFSKDEWIKEINGQREILNLYGGVKFEDIRGMRAPFLQTGGNNMFEMLYETNFTYDSSLPVQENHPAFWPYTLDYALSHSCNIPPCPTKSFPGVWEVGMIMWTDLRGGRCSMGDACTNPSDENGVYEMLIKNFNRHYKNNRSPFSLYYHSAWFNVQHHRKGFLRFLDEILQHQDVYMTTTWQMLQWVRQPVSLDQLNSFEPFQCNKQEKPIRECTRANICNVHSKQGSRTLRTCQECPTTFPWIGNTGFSKSKYG
ncbi:chitin binding [Dermatophagoides pteronyssinus]|uniref:Chitin binding n=1 Tax=Dermatophagoides pteronyssinus TaxID=6956 RepID=A0ABQ8JW15_DERPT|nr:chitin binding [Dermatophagoides pteronyssinus]